jgi:hypothetical protein
LTLGGRFVRLYARTYPRDVLGLVLVDAYSETLETLLTQRWATLVRLNVRSGSDKVTTIPSYGDLETRSARTSVMASGLAYCVRPVVRTCTAFRKSWRGIGNALSFQPVDSPWIRPIAMFVRKFIPSPLQ